MRLIDKKGRFFGAVNIIDLIVIFILFCIIAVLFPKINKLYTVERIRYSVVRTNRPLPPPAAVVKSSEPQPDYQAMTRKAMTLEIRFSGYNAEVAHAVSKGDKDEETMAFITEVLSVNPMLRTTDQGVRYSDPYMKSIVVKMRAVVSYEGDKLYFRNESLKIGGHFLFKTGKYDMNGEVIKIDPVKID
jgi:hypothetical protein